MKYLLSILLLVFCQIARADLHWVKYSGIIPSGAVNGGQEPGRTLYICRGSFQGGIHPGKIVDGRCNIGWGGREHSLTSFEVLVGNAVLKWVDVQGNSGPRFNAGINITYDGNVWSIKPITGPDGHPPAADIWYAFKGGSEANGTPLIICNAKYYPGNRLSRVIRRSRGRHPGKVVNGNCNFGYGGAEIVWPHEFRILVVKGQYQ